MLRASSVEILLTSEDLKQVIAAYAAGDVQDLDLEFRDGEAVVRHRVVADKLRVAIPVELRFQVESVSQSTVVARVVWSNLSLVPSFLKEYALQKAFEPLPGQYEDGRFTVDLARIMEDMPVTFALHSASIEPEGLRILLRDMVVYPLETRGAEEPAALVPVPSTEEAEIPEHQDYYVQFRQRVQQWAAEKAPRWVQPLVPWVLAAPDFFVLLVRLARDERVSPMAKVMAGLVVTYFVVPLDLIPDVLAVMGSVDDVAVALFALEQMAERIPAELVEELWPGEGRVLELVQEGTKLFAKVLPTQTMAAIRRLLARR